jgi:hypothetical protein
MLLKLEIRSPKYETNSNHQNSKGQNKDHGHAALMAMPPDAHQRTSEAQQRTTEVQQRTSACNSVHHRTSQYIMVHQKWAKSAFLA